MRRPTVLPCAAHHWLSHSRREVEFESHALSRHVIARHSVELYAVRLQVLAIASSRDAHLRPPPMRTVLLPNRAEVDGSPHARSQAGSARTKLMYAARPVGSVRR